jgi:Tissue inhibitor of metalloproteinase
MKRIFIIFISIFFLFSLKGYACSCVPPDTPEKELQQADAVFSGKVIKVEEGGSGEFSANSSSQVSVTLEVKEIWKGIEENRIVVKTEQHSASCGYEFEKNKEYIVYAQKQGNEWYVSLCSRTTILAEAGEDVKALGKGDPPTTIVASTESDVVEIVKGWGIAVFILTLLIGLYYFIRETNR